jgi:hypothetical protein
MESACISAERECLVTLQRAQNRPREGCEEAESKIPVQKVLGDESRESRKMQNSAVDLQMLRIRINRFHLNSAYMISISEFIRLRMMFPRSNSFAFC